MLDREIVVTIPGHPAPKGSLKCVGARGKVRHALVEDNAASQPWRDKIAGLFRTRVRSIAERRQPCGVEVTFTIDRGPSHYGTGRNAGTLKASAPRRPTAKGEGGDVDKLARLLLDALEDAGTLPNDAQVVELTARKAYATPHHDGVPDALPWPGVKVRLYPL